MTGLHGWIVLDKPLGLGSTQGVSAVKRALRQGGYGKAKVGHGGTLDPLATGVLPIAVGEATKLAGRLLDGDKAYDFTIGFGEQTETLDAEGKVIAASDVRPTAAAVDAILPRFTGPISQVPPAFSALKIDGERAYDLARAGGEVVLAMREVVIRHLSTSPERGGGPLGGSRVAEGQFRATPLVAAPPPPLCGGPPPRAGEVIGDITLSAHVSKGTYIRSLARDIALALGTVGHVTMLRRTKAGPFDLSQAISLDKLDEAAKSRTLEHLLLPLRAGLDDIPALLLTPDQAGALRQGRVLAGIDAGDGVTLATLDDVPVALVEVRDRAVTIIRGFNM